MVRGGVVASKRESLDFREAGFGKEAGLALMRGAGAYALAPRRQRSPAPKFISGEPMNVIAPAAPIATPLAIHQSEPSFRASPP